MFPTSARALLGSLAFCVGLGCSGAAPEPLTAGPDARSQATPAQRLPPSAPPGQAHGSGGSGEPDVGSAANAPPAADGGAPSPLQSDGGAGSAPAVATMGPPTLATFHAALADLQCGRRQDHVRIVWLGDSHAQADFWTDTVRVGLQQRFGDGGPGFVRMGYRDYRHAGVRLHLQGKWRNRPKQPATTERYADGALGLGGILTAGWADQPATSVELTSPGVAARPMFWDVCYKLTEPGAGFRVELTGAAPLEVKSDGSSSVRHVRLTGHGNGTLRVVPGAGRPELCGVVVEATPASGPGVVLDNLGINGARYATALAWDAGAWATELARRNPELVVVEYGGNEAGDYVSRPEAYQRHLTTLVERIRRVRPDVSCLVVGLAEREDRESRIVAIRDAQREGAKQAGCMFWDTYEVMGGAGSMRSWREQKKAAPDGIHLMPRGYAELGTRLTQDLLVGLEPACSR